MFLVQILRYAQLCISFLHSYKLIFFFYLSNVAFVNILHHASSFYILRQNFLRLLLCVCVCVSMHRLTHAIVCSLCEVAWCGLVHRWVWGCSPVLAWNRTIQGSGLAPNAIRSTVRQNGLSSEPLRPVTAEEQEYEPVFLSWYGKVLVERRNWRWEERSTGSYVATCTSQHLCLRGHLGLPGQGHLSCSSELCTDSWTDGQQTTPNKKQVLM